jgi:hypothetical protein
MRRFTPRGRVNVSFLPGAFAIFSLWACQGEYPLSPTLCDDWCHLTEPAACDYYSPAGCVRECENSGFATSCASELEAAITCAKAFPREVTSCFDFAGAVAQECEPKYSALIECSSRQPRE